MDKRGEQQETVEQGTTPAKVPATGELSEDQLEGCVGGLGDVIRGGLLPGEPGSNAADLK